MRINKYQKDRRDEHMIYFRREINCSLFLETVLPISRESDHISPKESSIVEYIKGKHYSQK